MDVGIEGVGQSVRESRPVGRHARRRGEQDGYLVRAVAGIGQAYGVVEIDDSGRALRFKEKPMRPGPRWAVPGRYLYPPGVADKTRQLAQSERGELEITDLNSRYMEEGRLRVMRMGSGTAWLDTGTAGDLLEAANSILAAQHRQGRIIGCPEEVAFRKGFIDRRGLVESMAALAECTYRAYLEQIAEEAVW